MRVRDPRDAAKALIAGDRTFLHQCAPEERHELHAPLLRCRRPIARVERVGFDWCFSGDRTQDLQVETTEDLLVPGAVERDEHDVLCAPLSGCGRRSRREDSECQNKTRDAATIHDHSLLGRPAFSDRPTLEPPAPPDRRTASCRDRPGRPPP